MDTIKKKRPSNMQEKNEASHDQLQNWKGGSVNSVATRIALKMAGMQYTFYILD